MSWQRVTALQQKKQTIVATNSDRKEIEKGFETIWSLEETKGTNATEANGKKSGRGDKERGTRTTRGESSNTTTGGENIRMEKECATTQQIANSPVKMFKNR